MTSRAAIVGSFRAIVPQVSPTISGQNELYIVLHERLGDGPTHVFCAHIIMVHSQRAVYASQRPISVQRHGFSVVFLGTHFYVSEVKAGWVEYQRSARYLKFRFWSD